MMKRLVPKNEIYFDLFDKLCAGIVEGARLLNVMLEGGPGTADCAQRIKTIEHEADQTVHAMMAKLHTTFITPINREDIHELAVHLDDILDQIEAASSRITLFCPDCIPPETRDLGAVVFESAKLVQEMVGLLRRLKEPKRILELTVEIDRLEDDADTIRRATVARLFREEKNPFELIKWKDILEFMERATDCCEDAANITEGIVLENT